jgi:hypothetical protein
LVLDDLRGVDRHEAIHAIASVSSDHITDILRRRPGINAFIPTVGSPCVI